MNGSSRIELSDTLTGMVYKLSGGNPGALKVLLQLCQDSTAIDPDNGFGGFGPLMRLDELGVYGSRIWMLFKDVCDSNLTKMVALLRAHQLGLVDEISIGHAIDDHGFGIDVDELVSQVKIRLPKFGVEKVEVAKGESDAGNEKVSMFRLRSDD